MDEGSHDRVVAALFAAATGEASWISTLGTAADCFGHSAAVMTMQDAATGIFTAECHGRAADYANNHYASELFANDPRTPYLLGVKPGSIYFDHALYDVDAINRDPNCRRSVDALGVKYQLGMVVRLPHGGPGYFTLLSTAAEGHATVETIAAFRRIAPFVEQACALGQVTELRAATQIALIEALSRRADGVVLLDRTGAPVFVNEAAAAIFAQDDGLAWNGGALAARRGPETRRLHGLIRSAALAMAGDGGPPGGVTLINRPSGLRPYLVRVMPTPASERFLSAHSIACVVHIHDLARIDVPLTATLTATFGLTAREADLAIALIQCASLHPAAARAGMALNTARNHLHSIFEKCGATNQAELIQLLGRLA
ncbi:helix-turn-helix transcriptional regulator [Sphingomonas sp. LT1P40]|uniref:helix-turn-helix transcriptional regulator n=1 Tax=Alteristakelama amylovorans TaxID=3096166 RepID=UPI002FCC7B0A